MRIWDEIRQELEKLRQEVAELRNKVAALEVAQPDTEIGAEQPQQ
jgi:hypothetical protein